MSAHQKRIVVIALWLLSIVAVGTLVHAQLRSVPTGPTTVLSGADIGFQTTDSGGKTVVGKLVVRVNGQWKDAEFQSQGRVQPLSLK
jgi:hypothetical protein